MRGLTAFHSLLLVLLLAGCTPVSTLQGRPDRPREPMTGPDPAVSGPCSRHEAIAWAADARQDVDAALKAANCCAYLVKTGKDRDSRLADARMGRQLAERALQQRSQSGLAHYLYAYLTALEAENDPLQGLELVPVIEREARIAAGLDPSMDHAGPYRILGELYLRAPGIPVSIGNVEKAVASYRRAVAIAPGFPENRLGLAEALLEAEETKAACFELTVIIDHMTPDTARSAEWQRALELLKRLCGMQEDR